MQQLLKVARIRLSFISLGTGGGGGGGAGGVAGGCWPRGVKGWDGS